jgi:hypothetical protein
MKKIFVIVLIMLVFSLSVEAKVKFGSWDKWDEELPPADNENWEWFYAGHCPVPVVGKISSEGNNINLLLLSDLYFKGKGGKVEVLVTFYTAGQESIAEWNIARANFALAAFPPKEGKMTIRIYIKEKEETFKFFEQYQIPFKKGETVVPEEAKFRELFKEFVVDQVVRIGAEELFAKINEEKLSSHLLPKLLVEETWYAMRAPW